MSALPAPPVSTVNALELPKPYLLFLGDVTEAGYAKTAFGLRDWARELCVGEFASPRRDGHDRAAEAHAA